MRKATHKILVIDDEPELARAVRLTITIQEPDWEVIETHSGQRGLELIETEAPDLALLDLMMPEIHGFEVLKQIRLFSDLPVIILTVKDDELEKVHGLELGADDYIVKPFGHLELLARIRSVLRRVEGFSGAQERKLQSGRLQIDFDHRRVALDGREIKFTHTEFKLLEVLARSAGRIVTNEILLNRVWGYQALDDVDYLKVFIYRLRQKLESDPSNPRLILTERSIGYWLDPQAG